MSSMYRTNGVIIRIVCMCSIRSGRARDEFNDHVGLFSRSHATCIRHSINEDRFYLITCIPEYANNIFIWECRHIDFIDQISCSRTPCYRLLIFSPLSFFSLQSNQDVITSQQDFVYFVYFCSEALQITYLHSMKSCHIPHLFASQSELFHRIRCPCPEQVVSHSACLTYLCSKGTSYGIGGGRFKSGTQWQPNIWRSFVYSIIYANNVCLC